MDIDNTQKKTVTIALKLMGGIKTDCILEARKYQVYTGWGWSGVYHLGKVWNPFKDLYACYDAEEKLIERRLMSSYIKHFVNKDEDFPSPQFFLHITAEDKAEAIYQTVKDLKRNENEINYKENVNTTTR